LLIWIIRVAKRRVQPDQAGDVGDAGFRIGEQPLQPRQDAGDGRKLAQLGHQPLRREVFRGCLLEGHGINLVENQARSQHYTGQTSGDFPTAGYLPLPAARVACTS
jgi:hypothetical protein